MAAHASAAPPRQEPAAAQSRAGWPAPEPGDGRVCGVWISCEWLGLPRGNGLQPEWQGPRRPPRSRQSRLIRAPGARTVMGPRSPRRRAAYRVYVVELRRTSQTGGRAGARRAPASGARTGARWLIRSVPCSRLPGPPGWCSSTTSASSPGAPTCAPRARGPGCGAHWPLCDGRIIPRSLGVATVIEYSHRITSGLALLSVLALLWWVRKSMPPGHPARRGALMSVVFMLTEAAVGAGLVLFELVADNASMARALFMAVHLTNTFVLIAWLALTAWWLSGGEAMTPAATPGRSSGPCRIARGRDCRGGERRHCRAWRHAVPVEDAGRGAGGGRVTDLAPAPAAPDAASRTRHRHGRAPGDHGAVAGAARRHAAGRTPRPRRGRPGHDPTAGRRDQRDAARTGVDAVAPPACSPTRCGSRSCCSVRCSCGARRSRCRRARSPSRNASE